MTAVRTTLRIPQPPQSAVQTGVTHSLYDSHAALIDDVLAWIARRWGLDDDDAQEFASDARLKLLADDSQVLRQHKGRSTMRTYLSVVLSNHFQDWRRKKEGGGGRWRPSVAARHAGEVAVQLERLMMRDGLTFEQAVETLRSNYGCTVPRDELYELSLRFPARERRTLVGEDALDASASAETADAILVASESEKMGERVAEVLAREIQELDPRDRLVLKLLFEDDTPLTAIARTLNLPYGTLYRRHQQVLRRLQGALKAAGIGSGAAADLSVARAAMRLEALLQKSGRGPSLE